MILMVSGATTTRRWLGPHAQLGWLKTPGNGNRVAMIAESGDDWCCDNECYTSLDRERYITMLRQVSQCDQSRLRFVVAPDVVADAPATIARFQLWRPVLDYFKLPIAFAAQDGQQSLPVPWDAIACLFIGGSTSWKLSRHAEQLIREAHARGKWVHVGRVNTLRRMVWLSSLPVNSIDGSSFSRWSDRHIPWMLRHMANVQHRIEGI